MDMKVAVAAGLSFLTFAYWQRDKQPQARTWTLAGVSGKVKSMLERRNQVLGLGTTEGEWRRDRQLGEMLSSASESEIF